MLNFCPYEADVTQEGKEFLEIDMNNLAYELLFMNGFKYENLEVTVLGPAPSFIHQSKDARLSNAYLDNSIHYMLWESRNAKTPNGLKQLFAAIDKGNQNNRDNMQGAGDVQVDLEESDPEESGGMLRYDEQEDGTYVISYSEDSGRRRKAIMKAVPCCPSCHKRLPLGWNTADDFFGISLIGRSGGGKTTFLLSLMADNWQALKSLGSDWQFFAAHDMKKENDSWYHTLIEASKKMCQFQGECPPSTQTGYLVAPVFIAALYNRHKIIIGLYDNSGEVLKSMDPDDERIALLSNMFAHIYFIEPDQTRIELPDKKVKHPDTDIKVPELLTLEEQGEFQKNNRGKEISGMELLRPEKTDNARRVRREDPLRMYRDLRDVYFNNDVLDKLADQHMCCTLIKCDLLENIEEVREMEDADFLFQHGEPDDLLHENIQILRQDILKKFFLNFVFSKEKDLELLSKDFCDSVSLHCISALGCDTNFVAREGSIENIGIGEKVDGVYYLEGEYDPIRVAEPLITCIKKRVEENGW